MEWLDQQRRMEDDPTYLPGVPPLPDDAAVRTGNPYDPFALAHAKTTAAAMMAGAGASSLGIVGGGVSTMGQLGSVGVNTVGALAHLISFPFELHSGMVWYITSL